MTKKSSGPRPLDSYPPEFFKAWALAAEGKLSISFPTRGQAVSFRQRLNTFRKRLRETSPEAASPFESAELSLEATGNGDETLVVSKTSDWKRQLETAHEPALLVPPYLRRVPEEPTAPAANELDSTLAGLGFGASNDGK